MSALCQKQTCRPLLDIIDGGGTRVLSWWAATVKLPRRKLLHLTAGATALPVASHFAWAQTYPSRSVRIIAGFPPGGFTDTTARLIGSSLSERVGQQFFVENRPGASSNIATEAVAHAPPDGYTLLIATDANAYNATLYDNLKFNFIKDMTPVASIGRVAFVMVVNPAFAAKTVLEFIANAKANPGKINMATVGPGSPSQLFGVLFKSIAGVDLVTVNYRGTLLDGTEFDSSYKRGQPATFPVTRVIPGWTEALQLMKPGAKYKLFVPPQLAYDLRSRPPIPPGSPCGSATSSAPVASAMVLSSLIRRCCP